MLSVNFFNNHIMPIVFDICRIGKEESVASGIKAAAAKGIEYLLVMENGRPFGIVALNSLLSEIDRLSDLVWQDFTDSHFYLVQEEDLEQLQLQEIPDRFVLIQKGSEYAGVMDLKHTPSYYKQMLYGTIGIMDSILNSAYNGIIALDEGKNIVGINKSAADFYGVEEKDVIDQPLKVKIPQSALNDFIFELEPSVLNKLQIGNKYVQANRTSMRIRGRIAGGISVFQDITNSEAVNKELAVVKENEKFLESVIANSYDGIYLTDRNGLTLAVNQSYERITGIDKEQLVGKHMKNLVAQGLLSDYITDDVVAQKKPITHNQTIRNGKKVVITGSPIFDENGVVTKVITNVRDITELINLEKKLLISNEVTNLYQKELFREVSTENIVCRSRKFAETIELAKRVSSKDSTVLILGETGAGKEIVARYIHMNSKRKNSHYVKINCGSIPANLLESELFGYVPGSFTGASSKGKVGMFELASEGTLFLDEIGEMPIDLQSSLLRVLQDGEVIRVGDTKSRKVNVRIIAATNRNLEEMISKGTFRSDLFYRLNVVSIYVPPLRERLEDIPALAEHFISRLNEKYDEKKVITSNFINQLLRMDWPGNIREMSNFIEKQFVISDDDIMNIVVNYQTGAPEIETGSSGITVNGIIPLNDAIKEVESILVGRAMRKCRTTYKAAELLKVSQPTFFRKYKEYYGEELQGKDGQEEDE
ncbi:MAG TPA: sigma 54-interacting transcriptional regulator [Anaerovoracaceae bacterium]|nr:sigma 54-interacting transcriptional regulator [Anaerovoracaceae bacterium]